MLHIYDISHLRVKVYKKDKPHKFGYELLCCAVIWALATGLKFTVGRRMITNSGKLRSLIWEQVAALYFDYTEIEYNLKIKYCVLIDITHH